ncbi:MAG: hypothetical protein ABH821_02470 [archaeon]
MPFTLLHFGPLLLIGLIFFSVFNLSAVLLPNILIDLEPLTLYSVNYFFGTTFLEHNFFHSFLGATFIALITAFLVIKFFGFFNNLQGKFKLKQKQDNKLIVFSSFFGAFTHILFDSIQCNQMNTFLPLPGNPLCVPGSWQFFALGFTALLLISLFLIILKKKK